MKHARGVLTLVMVIMAVTGLTLAGGLWTKADAAAETFSCVAEAKLDKEIASEAQLEEFSCFFKRWEGSDTLHFKVAIKNVSDQPQRFRVNIFLDNGKGVGGLIPQKTAKGLVKPGESAAFVYPVTGMANKAMGITLKISTIGQ